MGLCPICKTGWNELPDERGDHPCPKCGYGPVRCPTCNEWTFPDDINEENRCPKCEEE